MKRKLLLLALMVSLGVAMTPLVSMASTNYITSIATSPAPDQISDTHPTAIAPTPATEPGGLDGISARFVDIVRETAAPAPVACTAKACRLGAVTQGGSCSSRFVAADLKKRTFANFRGRGQRLMNNRR